MEISSSIHIFAKGTLGFLWLFIFSSAEASAQAETPADTIGAVNELHEVQVTGHAPQRMRRLDSGAMQFNSGGITMAGRTLGESDYIAAMKRLAGVSAIGDYASGIAVDGASPSHALFRIEGAPVFFPYRFGGIFSTFNTYHFNRATFERSFHRGAKPSRLGALADMSDRRRVPEHIEGTANAGLLASSAATRLPLGEKAVVAAAARISYVDELYGSILKSGHQDISYRFHDFNLSATWNIDSRNRLNLSGFLSKDRLSFDDSNYSMLMKMNWDNRLLTFSWEHTGSTPAAIRVWHSAFNSSFDIVMSQFGVKSPAKISNTGGYSEISFRHGLPWATTAGIELNRYDATPQWAEVKGSMPNFEGNSPNPSHMGEGRLFFDISVPMPGNINLATGVSASAFLNSGYSSTNIDPRATLTIHLNPTRALRLHIGSYSQYLHQFGFSDIGLASDFWSGSTQRTPPQKSWDFSAEYSDVIPGTDMTVTATAYWKQVKSQSEFSGQLLDIVNSSYDYQSNIVLSRGYNTGINLSAGGPLGPVTLNASYSWGIARRHTPGSHKWWRSIFSPGNSLKLDTDMTKGKWTFGASFSLASGRVYTPAKAIYVIANNVATIYGERNSARMPLYHRLDLSASYSFRSGRQQNLRHLINLSIINAYGHKNVDMQYYVIAETTGDYSLKRISSLYRFMPSLSYSISF